MKVAIVTGGLGFIGTFLTEEIKHKYEKIIIVDNLSLRVHGKKENKENSYPNLVIGDVQESSTWKRVSNLLPTEEFKFDVFHLAADTSTGLSLTEPSAHVTTNILGTAVMCEFLVSRIEQLNQIVLTSTRAIYGEGLWLTQDGEAVRPEPRKLIDLENSYWNPKYQEEFCISPIPVESSIAVPEPVNIYGSTKLSQESILRIWCNSYNIKFAIFRLQNVYGPGQSLWNSYSGVISHFVRNALEGKAIEVYEGGGIVRDLIYVKDVAKILAFDEDLPIGINTIDVGSGQPRTLLEIGKIILDCTGSEELVVSNKFRIGDVRGISADTSNLLKFNDSFKITPLEIGISQLVDWAKSEIESSRKNNV